MISYTSIEQVKDREVFFYSLIGSKNLNIDYNKSDSDYIYYLIPTSDDLYRCKYASFPQEITTYEDKSFVDVRKYPIYNPGFNELDSLFSTQFVVNIKYKDEFNKLYELREEIISNNINKLVKSILGHSNSAIKHNNRKRMILSLLLTMRLIKYNEIGNYQRSYELDEDTRQYFINLKINNDISDLEIKNKLIENIKHVESITFKDIKTNVIDRCEEVIRSMII